MILSLDGYLRSRRGTVDGITGEHADIGRGSDQIPVWLPEWDSNISFNHLILCLSLMDMSSVILFILHVLFIGMSLLLNIYVNEHFLISCFCLF